MNDVRNGVAPRRGNDIRRRADIVVKKRLFHQRADLGVIEDHRVGAGEGPFPSSRLGEIGLYHLDARVESRERCGIGGMFVDGRDPAVTALGQTLDQILTHEAGTAGDNDFAFRRHRGPGGQRLVL